MNLDIVHVLTHASTAELAGLTLGSDLWHTAGISRLGVEPMMMADGPHGLRVEVEANLGASAPATCFPPAVALGSTWNPDLLREVGVALGREAAALGVSLLLGPGMNIKRSPLCGRNFEYFSEDPLVTGVLASAMVEGIQSRGIGACAKHFAANNSETDRMRVSAEVTERALREIYFPAFERVITQQQPWLVMCSYNAVNGVPASQNSWLLNDVLRGDWGFAGVVVSDWGAVIDRVQALIAGLDLEMPPALGISDAEVVAAVDSGALSREVLELAAERVLDLGRRSVVHSHLREPVIGHHDLAVRAAAESLVLLKNDEGVLPLAPGVRVALIGEFARTPRIQGGGSSKVNPIQVDRLLDALGERSSVTFAPGFLLSGMDDDALTAEAVEVARAADVVVLCLGLPDAEESEGFDRTRLDLPANQLALLRRIVQVNPRVVVTLANGGVVCLAPWDEDVPAILECWLTGEGAGTALAQVLTGEVNPSGRLAETIGIRLEDNPSYLSFPGESGRAIYGEGVFVGYRGYTGRPVSYPFGFGLTYTEFRYDDLSIETSGSVATGDLEVIANVTIENVGTRAGKEVVQVYVADPVCSLPRPAWELRGFAKVALEPGESRTVHIPLGERAFAFFSEAHGRFVIESGEFVIAAGPHSREHALQQTITLEAPSLVRPLHAESTISEFFATPGAVEQLTALRARDGVGPWVLPAEMLAVVSGMPIRRFAKFPGVELDLAHVDAVLEVSRD